MEACLTTPPPRVKRVCELLEGESDSEVVELSMLAKDEGRSEATPPGARNLGEKKGGWLEEGGGGFSPVSPGSYTTCVCVCEIGSSDS